MEADKYSTLSDGELDEFDLEGAIAAQPQAKKSKLDDANEYWDLLDDSLDDFDVDAAIQQSLSHIEGTYQEQFLAFLQKGATASTLCDDFPLGYAQLQDSVEEEFLEDCAEEFSPQDEEMADYVVEGEEIDVFGNIVLGELEDEDGPTKREMEAMDNEYYHQWDDDEYI